MEFDLSEEQRMVKDLARKFSDEEIAPVARENDRNEHFPREIIQKMAELGLLGGPVPEEYGGGGLDYITYAMIVEEIGRGCSSVRTTISVQLSLVALTLLKWGNEEQKRKYLPALCSAKIIGCFGLTEPGAGSDPSGMATTARKVDGGWVLNGAKTWISNGGVADMAIVFAQADPSLKHKGITAFLIDKGTSGFSTRDIHGKLGLRASNTAELFLQEVRVSDDAILGKVGDGFKIAMSALDSGRYSVAAGCVGIIQASIEASTKYAHERRQFGRPIGTFQLVQEKIARMAVDCEAARLLVFKAGHQKNKGVRSTLETSMAK
ncbi:MAG: acyl-CoA dehydrogenase family protein, partial [Nitrospirota bacterium]|nr:acyl-CoA dehydrogenase family protein [Nitrospirota bacterium]